MRVGMEARGGGGGRRGGSGDTTVWVHRLERLPKVRGFPPSLGPATARHALLHLCGDGLAPCPEQGKERGGAGAGHTCWQGVLLEGQWGATAGGGEVGPLVLSTDVQSILLKNRDFQAQPPNLRPARRRPARQAPAIQASMPVRRAAGWRPAAPWPPPRPPP